jgi:hypothetical protein
MHPTLISNPDDGSGTANGSGARDTSAMKAEASKPTGVARPENVSVWLPDLVSISRVSLVHAVGMVV